MATESHRRRWPQRLWLEAVDTVRSRLGRGRAPPGGRLGHPTTCGPGNRWTEFGGDVAPGKEPAGANCSHQMQCQSCVRGYPGGEGPQRGHPRMWSPGGGPRDVELQPAEPPWGHSGQVQPPTAARSPGLGGGACSLRGVTLGVLGEKALAGLCQPQTPRPPISPSAHWEGGMGVVVPGTPSQAQVLGL